MYSNLLKGRKDIKSVSTLVDVVKESLHYCSNYLLERLVGYHDFSEMYSDFNNACVLLAGLILEIQESTIDEFNQNYITWSAQLEYVRKKLAEVLVQLSYGYLCIYDPEYLK